MATPNKNAPDFGRYGKCEECGQIAVGPRHSIPGRDKMCGWWWSQSDVWTYYGYLEDCQ